MPVDLARQMSTRRPIRFYQVDVLWPFSLTVWDDFKDIHSGLCHSEGLSTTSLSAVEGIQPLNHSCPTRLRSPLPRTFLSQLAFDHGQPSERTKRNQHRLPDVRMSSGWSSVQRKFWVLTKPLLTPHAWSGFVRTPGWVDMSSTMRWRWP